MDEKILHRATVCYLRTIRQVNLPIKKQKIGAGKRNGYGGGRNHGESSEMCAARETLEEGRVKTWPEEVTPVALLRCHNRTESGKIFLCVVHVFQTSYWLGEPRETLEMGPPAWFPIDALPLHELMLADRIWLPRLFSSQKLLVVTAHYGPHQASLEEAPVIEEVERLPEE